VTAAVGVLAIVAVWLASLDQVKMVENLVRDAKIGVAKATVKLRLIDRDAIFDAVKAGDNIVCGIVRQSFDPTKRLYFAYSSPPETLVIANSGSELMLVAEMCEALAPQPKPQAMLPTQPVPVVPWDGSTAQKAVTPRAQTQGDANSTIPLPRPRPANATGPLRISPQ
jgi:hypothetical protein